MMWALVAAAFAVQFVGAQWPMLTLMRGLAGTCVWMLLFSHKEYFGYRRSNAAWIGAGFVGCCQWGPEIECIICSLVFGLFTFFWQLDDQLCLPDDIFLREQLSADTTQQSVELKGTGTRDTTPIRRLRSHADKLQKTHACCPDCDTIVKILDRGERLFRDNPLCATRVLRKNGTFGKYISRSYGEVLQDVRKLEQNLNGKLTGGKLGLFSKNCEEVAISMFGGLRLGLAIVPLYDSLGPEAIRHIVNHAELDTICTSEQNLEIVLRLLSPPSTNADDMDAICYDLRTIYVFKDHTVVQSSVNRGPRRFRGVDIIPFEQLLKEKSDDNEKYREKLVHPSDTSFILYTSGTTGVPKGVVLTHETLIASAAGLVTTVIVNETDVHLSYLPLAHAFEIAVIIAGVIRGGSVGWYHGNVKELTDDAVALRPTMFIGVPRVFQRVQQVVQQKFALKPTLIRKLCYHAVHTQIQSVRETGKRNWLYDLLVFSQVKRALGGRVRIMCTGSAPLAPSIQEFIKVCFDVPVVEGYGATETSGVSHAMLGGIGGNFDTTVGHVGPPLACSEYRLRSVPEMGYTIQDLGGPRGEIEVRGVNIFKGYYKDEEKTVQALTKDGWLKTGDVGRINKNGTLSIIDRIKNVFKTSLGEFIASERIETILLQCPVVGQIYVYGSAYESKLVAIVVPDPLELIPRLRKGAIPTIREADIPVLSTDLDSWLGPFEALCCSDHYGSLIREYILCEMDKVSKVAELKGFEYVKAIHVEAKLNKLMQVFSVENGLLTPTFKLKRHKIRKDFEKQLEALYAQLE
mmetsp:Transcript_14113/g.25065  ORF Transcript_14113/g.25065 Transcript_14113/m.25065 type:complete len:801 (-) Transcript_14113:1959-4361(-)